MPVVFAPADPFSARIASEYGASEVNSRREAMRSQERMNAQRIAAQVGVAQMQANMQAAGQSAANFRNADDAQRDMQSRERVEGWRNNTAYNIAAERNDAARQMQADNFFYDSALMGQKVSQSEVLRMNQMETALSEVAGQVQAGTLTPEEAAPLVMEIKTGIDPIKRRVEQQTAQLRQAQAKQELEETAKQTAIRERGSQMTAENFPKSVARVKDAQGNETEWAITGYNQYGPQFAQVKKEKQEDPQAKAAEEFKKEAKAYADKLAAQVEKVRDVYAARGKGKTDVPEPTREELFREARKDLEEAGITKPVDPNQPAARQQPAEDPVVQKIMSNPKVGPADLPKAIQAVAELRAILAKPKDQRTAEDNRRGQQLTALVSSLTGE